MAKTNTNNKTNAKTKTTNSTSNSDASSSSKSKSSPNVGDVAVKSYVTSHYSNPKISYSSATKTVMVTTNGKTATFRVTASNTYNNTLYLNPATISFYLGEPNKVSSISTSLYSTSVNRHNITATGPTVKGQYQDGLFTSSGSASAGYVELNAGETVQSKDTSASNSLGIFGKVSAINTQGKVGVGNGNLSTSLNAKGDLLTATGDLGINYKNGLGVEASAKAALASGSLTSEYDIFGVEIETGVSGYAGGIGGELKAGYFPDTGYTAKVGAIAGLGVGFDLSVKP